LRSRRLAGQWRLALVRTNQFNRWLAARVSLRLGPDESAQQSSRWMSVQWEAVCALRSCRQCNCSPSEFDVHYVSAFSEIYCLIVLPWKRSFHSEKMRCEQRSQSAAEHDSSPRADQLAFEKECANMNISEFLRLREIAAHRRALQFACALFFEQSKGWHSYSYTSWRKLGFASLLELGISERISRRANFSGYSSAYGVSHPRCSMA
jgi:hypothetical protein